MFWPFVKNFFSLSLKNCRTKNLAELLLEIDRAQIFWASGFELESGSGLGKLGFWAQNSLSI